MKLEKGTLIVVKWQRNSFLNGIIEYTVGWFLKCEHDLLFILSSRGNDDLFIEIPEKQIIKITEIQEAKECPF